jgi:hypothetical protein
MTYTREMLTQKELKRLLIFNKSTGVFTRRIKLWRGKPAGSVAGWISPNGYIEISINKKSFQAHRLAWLYIYGSWPTQEIDHINGVKNDNRICNLRDVSRRENIRNQQIHREGKLFGCSLHRKKWRAQISIDNKTIHIGTYSTEQEAHEAYLEYDRSRK